MEFKSLRAALIAGILGVCIGAAWPAAAAKYASHPFLHRAQKELRMTKGIMQRVTHPCGGHRDVAIQKLDAAIAEVDLAVAYADAHPQEDPAPVPK